MNIVHTIDTLNKFAELLKTPNLSRDNINQINHTMKYMIDNLHTPIVKMIDDQK